MTYRLVDDYRRTIISPICGWCKHLRNFGVDRTCDAFLDGIPVAIWEGEADHRVPHAGDHGIQFEARTTHGADEVSKWFGDDKKHAAGEQTEVA